MRVLVVALLLVALPLAGCFGKGGPPDVRHVSATGGKVSFSYAYDGAGLVPAGATLDGVVRNSDNTGVLNASFTLGGAKYQVTFDKFSATDAFKDGGVAFDLAEHGATGKGAATLPEIHGKIVAYGTATVTKDGKPLVGKAGSAWAAHLMVFNDAIRGSDGRITNAAGAPFDPSKPADAKVYPNTPQAILQLTSPDGAQAMRTPVAVDKNITVQGPNVSQTVAIPTEEGARALFINVSTSEFQGPLAVGNVSFVLKDAGGNVTDHKEGNVLPNGGPFAASFLVPAEKIRGPFSLVVSGNGAFNVRVHAAASYDDHPFLVVTYDGPAVTDG